MEIKKLFKLVMGLLLVPALGANLASCGNSNSSESGEEEWIDYTAQCKFNPNSGRVSVEATVHGFIDGDTTHFNVSWAENGIYKARYMGIDTPESTGAIEPWGKEASKFTKSKLESAHSIILESDSSEWQFDSTGGRYTTWVWYQPTEGADYRLLNLEIVQEGLSMLKTAGQTVYGEYFTKAFNQAKRAGIKVAGNQTDPNYYYGSVIYTNISELVLTPEKYSGLSVRVEGLITKVDSTTFYFESYDEAYDQIFGMDVFMGYSFSNAAAMQEGCQVSVAGVFAYSDIVSKWQISDLKYMAMKPDYEKNTNVLSTGNEVVPSEIDGSSLVGTRDYVFETKNEDDTVTYETKTFDNGYLYLFTRVKVENVTVTKVSTTSNGGSNDGAMTLYCQDANGKEIIARTSVLYKKVDGQNVLVEASEFTGKNISFNGIVDVYSSDYGTTYQVHVYYYNDITING